MNRRRTTLFCILSVTLVILAIGSPAIAEACKTKEKYDYDLDLLVGTKNGSFKTDLNVTVGTSMTLKATLIHVTERWVHKWVCTSNPASNSLILFYSCKSRGQADKYLGSARTNVKGIVTIQWSAWVSKVSDYWFIARYYSEDGHKHDSDGHS